MALYQYKNWMISVFAIIILVAASSYFYANDFNTGNSALTQLTDLSDADIDVIVSIKSEMYAASIESY